ncbi:hypothetical protein LPLAFNJD_LOCUS797 [Methylorubrum aminovorans]
MGLIASRNAVLALPKRYDARLELGGLPAVSALLLSWPISVALIVSVRFFSLGDISLSWGPPWIALPLFWPALVLLPFAAHIPTNLVPPVFALAGLAAGSKQWLPLIDGEADRPRQVMIDIVNGVAIDVAPPIIYGCVIAWLACRHSRSGPADMRGLRPYRAALLALLLLVALWFVIAFLILAFWLPPDLSVPDAGGLAVFLGTVVGGLIYSFPWAAIIAGIITISMTHGVPRPYLAIVFLTFTLALCPLNPPVPSASLLTVALNDVLGKLTLSGHPSFVTDPWRPFVCSAVGVAVYGFLLCLIQRRDAAILPALAIPTSGSIHEAVRSR